MRLSALAALLALSRRGAAAQPCEDALSSLLCGQILEQDPRACEYPYPRRVCNASCESDCADTPPAPSPPASNATLLGLAEQLAVVEGWRQAVLPQPRRTPAPLVDCLPRALPARVCHSPTSDLLRRGASCQGVNDALDTIWIVICATLVLMMQLGFAMLESGSVREHNVVATLAKNVLDVLIGTLTT